MKRNFFAKLFFVLAVALTAFSCSNYFGLTLAEREEVKIKDKPALRVQRLPTVLPCNNVFDHYEVEILALAEDNIRSPKSGDNYTVDFEAYVTTPVAITGFRVFTMNMPVMDIPLEIPIQSQDGILKVEHKLDFLKELPSLSVAIKDLRLVAILQSDPHSRLAITLKDGSKDHIKSDNVEIEYVEYDVQNDEGKIVLTLKNHDGSVFATVAGNPGEEVELPDQIPARTGHIFIKWLDVPEYFPQSNAEYEAVWEIAEYYVTYELNGGVNSDGNPDSFSYTDGTFQLYPPTKDKCLFAGWYTDSGYVNSVTSIFAGNAQDIKLYAKWIELSTGKIFLNPGVLIIVGGQSGRIEHHFELEDGTTPALSFVSGDTGIVQIDSSGNITTSVVPFDSENPVKSVKRVSVTARYKNIEASCQIVVLPTTLTYQIVQDVWPDYAELTDFTIPYGIETLKEVIGNRWGDDFGTFYFCKNLENVTMPDTLKTIGDYAFSGVPLKTLDMPDSVTSIGNSAFFSYSTDGLITSCNLSKNLESIGYNAFYKQKAMTGTLPPLTKLKYLGYFAFRNCNNLGGSVVFSEELKDLGESAFEDCSSLTGSVTIPNSIKTVSYQVFRNCSSLEAAKFEEGIETISYGMFSGCSNLKSVELPDSIKVIGSYAFYNCHSLQGPLELPESLETIGYYAFYCCCSIDEIKIPANSNLKSIGNDNYWGAFYNSVTKVTITGTLETWDAEYWNKDILYGFPKLKELEFENLPSGYYFDGVALYSDKNKTNLVYVLRCKANTTSNNEPMFKIPNSVTHIGDYALYGWGSYGSSCWFSWPDNCQIVSCGDYCLAGGSWRFMDVPNTVKFVGKGFVKDSGFRDGNGVTFYNTSGWYYTTDPTATSGTPVDVSDAVANGENFKEGGAWAYGYLKRN